MIARCRRLVGSSRFDAAILLVIVANALVLGAETYPAVVDAQGTLLRRLNDVFLGVFVVELLLRMVASLDPAGPRATVRRFAGNRWNLFDLVVVVASFLPGLRENATLLRLLRLARIVRVVRFLPDLQVIFGAVLRSIPGVASLAVMSALLIYVYGMVGWLIFHDHDPEQFGTIGSAMVTMFVLLTLENLPDYIAAGRDLSDWTLLFYLSYVLVASFLVFNLFIGIVIGSMEEARAQDREEKRIRERAAAAATDGREDDLIVAVEDKIDELKTTLEDLRGELRVRLAQDLERDAVSRRGDPAGRSGAPPA
ncbi:Ion transport protein [Patulibacter medicamentivorans]|uniref:Ion transport protein n=1 Tax=Patulibacter medicamentivorans TaxID=1097667 RepID=H0E744_9ACTN|nr:ion transporter [Patulibacter medicamentivorans]EHN10539.1 Ion transport protein [Patulibacter medicamentivorans]